MSIMSVYTVQASSLSAQLQDVASFVSSLPRDPLCLTGPLFAHARPTMPCISLVSVCCYSLIIIHHNISHVYMHSSTQNVKQSNQT